MLGLFFLLETWYYVISTLSSDGTYLIDSAQLRDFLNRHSPALTEAANASRALKRDCTTYGRQSTYVPLRGFERMPKNACTRLEENGKRWNGLAKLT